MTILAIIAAIAVLLTWYALWGRQWLKGKSWAQAAFSWIEPLERVLFKKSETILLGRLLWLGSGLVTCYDGLAIFARSLDMTPLTTRLMDLAHIPPDMRTMVGTAFVAGLGLSMNWLRGRVTKPLELVAVSDKDMAENPRVAEAVAMAEATKTEAVAVVATEAAKVA